MKVYDTPDTRPQVMAKAHLTFGQVS